MIRRTFLALVCLPFIKTRPWHTCDPVDHWEIRFMRSAGSRIKNVRNVGGWGSEGLNWLKEHGVNEQSDWPAPTGRRLSKC